MSALLPIDALAQTGAEKAKAQLETIEDVAGLTDLSFDELRSRDLSGVNDAMMRPASTPATREPQARANGEVVQNAPSTDLTRYREASPIANLSFAEISRMDPEELKNRIFENRPLSAPRQARTRAEREAATIRGLTEGEAIRGHTVIADTLNRDAAAATFAQERMQDAVAGEARSYSFGDKFSAAFEDTTITAAIFRQFDREAQDFDLDWVRDYSSKMTELEKGYTWEEARRLRRSSSQADFNRIAGEIAKSRDRKAIYMSGGGQGISIVAHMLDPVVWLALVALLSASMVVVRSRRRLRVPVGN
ncbi:hypothetical protein [Brevundimonas sp.]|uniref:hypothetical protein n=1 Tax=Brevundimonas sp. TaxID=1871086 RepID=UPI0028A65914|nr:hypothetical protein [Brevundimonas sp.]